VRDASRQHTEALQLLCVLHLRLQATPLLFGSLSFGKVGYHVGKIYGIASFVPDQENILDGRSHFAIDGNE